MKNKIKSAVVIGLMATTMAVSSANAEFPACPAGGNATIESWGPVEVLGAFIAAGAYIGYAAWWVENNIIYVAW